MGKSVIASMSVGSEDIIRAKAKQEILYLDDLIVVDNHLYDGRNERSIDIFKNNILENGLLQPIVVIVVDNGYEILVGHKRVLAHKLLVKDGHEEFDEIKALVFPKNSLDELDRWKVRMGSNPHNEYTIEEKKAILDKADELYEQLANAGKKPIGRKHEWIMALTGFGESVARRRSDALKSESPALAAKDLDKCNVSLKNRLQQLLATQVKVKNKTLTIYYTDVSDLNRILDICGLLEDSCDKNVVVNHRK